MNKPKIGKYFAYTDGPPFWGVEPCDEGERGDAVVLLRDGESVGGLEPWMAELLRIKADPMGFEDPTAEVADLPLLRIAHAISDILKAGGVT